jgi:hypothetical protein
MGLSARRSTVALDLWQYGEEAAAEALFRLSIQDFQRVCDRAYELASDIPDGATRGMMLAKACALAAVEVLEGASRPLARGRRRVEPLPEELQILAEDERRHYENLTPDAQERRWPGSP